MAVSLDDRGIITECSTCGRKNRLAYEGLRHAVKCGQCGTSLSPPNMPIEVRTTAEFDSLIEKSSLPVVVDYWAPWCGPCRMVAPEMEKVATRQSGKLVVIKVNTDVLGDLGERFGIRSIPTLAVFEGGRELTRTAGARPAADIEAFVAQATSTSHAR